VSSLTVVWVKCECELSVQIMTLCDYIMNSRRQVAQNCVNDKFCSMWIKVSVISLEVLCQFLWSDWGKEQKKRVRMLVLRMSIRNHQSRISSHSFRHSVIFLGWDFFHPDVFQGFAAAWFRSLLFCVIVQCRLVCYGRFGASLLL